MARAGEVHNITPISVFTDRVSHEVLDIIGDRVLEDARLLAPVLRTKPPGRGSFPREYGGYTSEHLGRQNGTDVEGFAYVDVGGATPEARVLIRYRGGAGGPGAYGGSRRRDPFLIHALEAQIGRDL